MATKQKKIRVYVQYFIQNDPWESLGEPNLFVLPEEYTNLNDVKVEDVYKYFPLRDRFSLYLRFYLDDKTQNLNEWIDLPPSATLPIYNNGSVYVKVLRLPKGTDIQFKNNDIFQKKKTKPEPVSQQNNPNLYQMNDDKVNQQNKQLNEINENLHQNPPQNTTIPTFFIPQDLDIEEKAKNLQEGNGMSMNAPYNSSSTIQVKETGLKSKATKEGIIQSVSKTPIPENKGQQVINEWDDIFSGIDFKNPKPERKSPKYDHSPNIKYSLENVFDPIDQNKTQTPPQSQQPSMPLHDLTDKNLMPIDKLPTNLSEDELKTRIDQIVKNWSMGLHERKNVLFLVSTLHEVWTNDPTWKGASTQELINNPKTLSSKCRSAKACLHPDRNQNKDFKTQYIASCLSQIFSEATDLYK